VGSPADSHPYGKIGAALVAEEPGPRLGLRRAAPRSPAFNNRGTPVTPL
jgi:hypothetical protein